MANVVLKTYAAGDNNQGSVTPQNDALIYQAAVPMNGLFFGGAITLSSANVLHVAAGMGIIGGRFFEVLESDVPVQLSASGDLLGRLYIHLDLSNADNPIEINAVTGASLPALSGNPNLNVSIGAFDMELCTFDINELTISNIVQTFPTITAANNQIRRATAYNVNDLVFCQSASNSLIFICTTAGTTAVQEPTGYTTITDGNTITDGTAVFKAVGLMAEIKRNQQLLAPVLTSLVAPTGGLSTGQQFIYNELLYKVTAVIAQGGTIVIGGNAELADCVTEQINDLNNKIYPDAIYANGITYTSSDTPITLQHDALVMLRHEADNSVNTTVSLACDFGTILSIRKWAEYNYTLIQPVYLPKGTVISGITGQTGAVAKATVKYINNR